MSFPGFQKTLDTLATATTQSDQVAILKTCMARAEMARFTYCGLVPPRGFRGPTVVTTHPDKWIRRYRRQKYIDTDPLVAALRHTVTPVFSQNVGHPDRTTALQRDFLADSRRQGIVNLVGIPIHGLGREFALLAASPDDPDASLPWLQKRAHDLQVVALHFHRAYYGAPDAPRLQRWASLTTREIEALRWTARGKTAWEVGEIMTIAETTVIQHLRNASKKLHVSSKLHAVTKALSLGVIWIE